MSTYAGPVDLHACLSDFGAHWPLNEHAITFIHL